ncbi:MAG: ABC transporter ATP-binding protein [Chthoniobacterales bacterium]
MLRIDGISKSFRGRLALHPLSLEVSRGEIFGLLGHNGAGKSTTFGVMLGQLHPDAGEVWLHGASVQRHRAKALARVGAIFETPAFYEYLSGWRNLELLVALSAVPDRNRLREVVALVGLEARIHDPVRVYSHGMRQRLALAQALLPDPDFILLDEPTEGLDPEGIQEMRRTILRLRDEHGLTIMLSSHLLPEVEQLCDRVAILNQGRLVFCGNWQTSKLAARRVKFTVNDWTRASQILTAHDCEIESDGVAILREETDAAAIVAAFVQAGIRVESVEPLRLSLENFYLQHVAP